MKKHFKIGEISKLYNIGVDSIRYYEEIGLLNPDRSESGYRHYSIHDIWRKWIYYPATITSSRLSVDSIRYYEEIGLLNPDRSESGYRHYSIHDIWRKWIYYPATITSSRLSLS